jgi:transcriptional regulator with XRE-family HTH domain
MGRKAKHYGGVTERGLGLELRHYREQAGLTLEKVGDVLGWSANTMSRLERGLRPETTPEEVSAILAAIGVRGHDREKLMRMAKGYSDQGWWDDRASVTDQVRTYVKFERRATRIFNVEPLLIPGLLQTPDYCRALLTAFGVDDDGIEIRLARRLARQAILARPQPPELVVVLCEFSLRQPVGGPSVMARQVRYLIQSAERPHVSVRVIPMSIAAHPALAGSFMVLEFADEPPVVYIESRLSALFPQVPEEIDTYMLDAERLTNLALNDQRSITLLRAIAKDLENMR